MAIETEIKTEGNKPKYPRLKVHKRHGYVVLFLTLNQGVVVANPEGRPRDNLFDYSESWVPAANDEDSWEDFTGRLIMSND